MRLNFIYNLLFSLSSFIIIQIFPLSLVIQFFPSSAGYAMVMLCEENNGAGRQSLVLYCCTYIAISTIFCFLQFEMVSLLHFAILVTFLLLHSLQYTAFAPSKVNQWETVYPSVQPCATFFSSCSGTARPADPAQQPTVSSSSSFDDIDLEVLAQGIKKILDNATKESSSSHSTVDHKKWKVTMPESSDLKNVKDVLSSMGECASDLKQKLWGNQSEEIQTVARSVVEGIGHAHWAATGLLIVAVVLERFETISYNQELCLDLLQEMWMLCNYIKKLRKVPQPTPELEDLLNKSLNLTVEGALMCCLQREAPRLTKFMNASSQRQRLNKLKTELNKTYTHLLLLIVISGVKTESQISRQETYPTDAVAIEGSVASVIQNLELDSEKSVVAVLIFGLGGVGKTTLADAVYAKPNNQDYKYSKVCLFENIETKPHITELQKRILDQISPGVYAQPQTPTEGQQCLARCFKDRPCFVYVDNVLDARELDKLLPQNLYTFKRLRILLTARDAAVSRGLHLGSSSAHLHMWQVNPVSPEQSMNILASAMGQNSLSGICDAMTYDDLEFVVRICGGLPLALHMVGRFMASEPNKAEALDMIKQEHDQCQGETFGAVNIDFFTFAFQNLSQDQKEAFFDICAFFLKYSWDDLETLFGKYTMQILQHRSLVRCFNKETLGFNLGFSDFTGVAVVHDVLLEAARKRWKTEGKRISTIEEAQNLLESNDENRFKDIKGINIRWSRQDASVAEVVRRSRFKLTATQLSVMAPSLRIFSADADMETGVLNVLHAIIIKDDLCSSSAEFKNLLFWQSKGRSIAFDLKQAPKLKFLRYAPACTVDMCQVPTSVEDLSIDLSGIPNEDVAIRFSMDQGTVPKVKRLVIAGLRASKMPQGVLTRLNSLTYLCIHNCDFLSELESHDFEHLINMVRLQLSNCKALRRLPQNLKKGSPNLRHLHVTYCPSLVDIPLNFQQLTSLVTVFITDCSQVTQLPHSMGECASLQILGLKNCSKLRELPRNFHLLSLLKVLSLRGCTSLESLPLHFGRLGSLEVLRLTSCTGLKHLSNDFNELPLQSQLNLSKCMALESHCIDMLVHMKSLQTVFIEETPQLIQRWQEIKHNAAEAVTQPVFITGLAEPATSQK